MTSENENKPEKPTAPVLGHNYDGIEEYDNPLPNWWLFIFLGTIIFGFLYFIHFNFGEAPTQKQELQADMKSLPQPSTRKNWTEIELTAPMASPENLQKGKAVFIARCSSCHGLEGQGVIGPNLTDSYWIHGKGKRVDLMQIISQGVVEKGMPAWAGMIPEDEILAVAGFVYSLRLTHPSNHKAPQGEEVKE